MTDTFCECCKEDRQAKGLEPRPMIHVGVHEAEKDYLFCGYCDGDALVMAKQLERMRADRE